jgi:predicted NBD/HSP70 family sugar kinase
MKSKKYNSVNKQIRKSSLLQLINKYRSITREEIINYTGINSTAIYSIVANLIKNKDIIESGYADSTSGRRSSLLSINPQIGVVIGLSLEQEYITAVVSDFGSNIITTERVELPDSSSGLSSDIIISKVIKVIEELISKIGMSKVLGIGIGIPGFIDKSRTTGIFNPHVPDWVNVNIKQQLEDRCKLPVYLEKKNDLAALFELYDNKIYNDLIYFHVDTGVAIGIIINREIYTGSTGTAGEFGHTLISGVSDRSCICGNKGCLESYVSVKSIIAQVKEAINHGVYTTLPLQFSFDDIITGYKQQDKLITVVVGNVARYLSIGIVNLVNIFNPGMIVLGGRVTWFGDELLSMIKHNVTSLIWRGNKDNLPVITFTKSGGYNYARGAVQLVIGKMIDFPPRHM